MSSFKKRRATWLPTKARDRANADQNRARTRGNVPSKQLGKRGRDRDYLAVVGSALLAGGFGLGGAWLGANSAVRSVEIQIMADAQQTHMNFLKEKRIDVYTSWLDSVNELAVKENTALNAIDALLLDRDPAASNAAIREASEHLLAMESLEVQLSIVGSADTSKAAAEMMSAHRSLIDQMDALRNNPDLVEDLPSMEEAVELLRRASTGLPPPPSSGGGTTPRPQLPGLDEATSEAAAEAARLLSDMGKSRGTTDSLSRLYALVARGATENEYTEFVTAVRADLAIEEIDPT